MKSLRTFTLRRILRTDHGKPALFSLDKLFAKASGLKPKTRKLRHHKPRAFTTFHSRQEAYNKVRTCSKAVTKPCAIQLHYVHHNFFINVTFL